MRDLYISTMDPNNLGQTQTVEKVKDAKDLAELITEVDWTPATFLEGQRRVKDNVEGTDFIALDIDEGCTLDQALDLFKDYWHVIVTSRNHQKEKGNKPPCDRFRVVLLANELIGDDETFKATWYALHKKFPFIDPACKDISRFFYAGKDIISVNDNGGPVEVSRPEPKENLTSDTEVPKTNTLDVSGALSKKTLQFLIDLAPDGEIHNNHVKALLDMKQQRLPLDRAMELSRKAFLLNDREFGYTEEKRVQDIYNNRDVKHDIRWPALIKTKAGGVKPDSTKGANYEHLICTIMDYKLYLNTLDGRIYKDNPNCTIPFEDSDYSKIGSRAMDEGLRDNIQTISREIDRIVSRRPVDPLRDPINAAELDPDRDYIQDLINTIEYDFDKYSDLSKERQTVLYDSYIRRWLIGAAAKLYSKGRVQNLTLVFYGGQGIGKSQWLGRLSPWARAFGEGPVDPNNKDHTLYHLNKFIHHIPELESVTGKREAGALKDFLTKDWISVRPAYARADRQGWSVCSFCASVNVEGFLNDWTGNRRFLTIPIKSMNFKHDIDITKVWAQAKELYKAGERWWLDLEEIRELEVVLERFKEETALDDFMGSIEGGEDFVSANEIFDAVGFTGNYNRFYGRLATALKKQGIEKARIKGKRGYYINKKALVKSLHPYHK